MSRLCLFCYLLGSPFYLPIRLHSPFRNGRTQIAKLGHTNTDCRGPERDHGNFSARLAAVARAERAVRRRAGARDRVGRRRSRNRVSRARCNRTNRIVLEVGLQVGQRRKARAVSVLHLPSADRVRDRLHVGSASLALRVGDRAQIHGQRDGHQDRKNENDDKKLDEREAASAAD